MTNQFEITKCSDNYSDLNDDGLIDHEQFDYNESFNEEVLCEPEPLPDHSYICESQQEQKKTKRTVETIGDYEQVLLNSSARSQRFAKNQT